ncbi:hypothetical protein HK405_004575, partial [Cladochytrium tenue]
MASVLGVLGALASRVALWQVLLVLPVLATVKVLAHYLAVTLLGTRRAARCLDGLH